MNLSELSQLVSRHGYVLIAAIVFAEAIGLPMPAALALIAAGAAVASKVLYFPTLLGVCVVAMLIGDSILYMIGRYSGWSLLAFLCKVSINPESCILRSAESFYKRGKVTLVVAKFIPGINTMAPPLAGSMKMRPLQFLRLDLAGAMLYSLAFIGLGFLSRDLLNALTKGFHTASRGVEVVLAVAIAGYIVYRVWLYKKNAVYRVVPRIPAQELARRLESEDAGKILVMDVRSQGYYDSGAARIRGSIRLEPNNLSEEMKTLSREKDIYLYCTCANDATSARVAHMLRENGFNAFVVAGGLAAWRKAGEPLEPVPLDDLVKLPTFS